MSGHGKPVGAPRGSPSHRVPAACARAIPLHVPSHAVLLPRQEGSRAQLRKNITPNSTGFGQFAFKKCMF